MFSTSDTLQGIFPTFRFICDGNLTQLIYRTIPGGSPYGQSERFGLWQMNQNQSLSNAIQVISLRSSEVFFRNVSSEASLYSLNDLDIPVQENDYLGLAVIAPSSLQFLDTMDENVSRYYYQAMLSSSVNFEEISALPYMPLITAIVSRMSLYHQLYLGGLSCAVSCLPAEQNSA